MARRLDRIYTRTGDRGLTGLAGGPRVSKASAAVESYGEADELLSHLGLLRALVRQQGGDVGASADILRVIQDDLFAIALVLATPATQPAYARRLAQFQRGRRAHGGGRPVRFLERRIDRCQRELPPLTRFVRPGSGVLTAQAHVARTVCRRFERVLVRRRAGEPVAPAVLAYANRLSDFLFVYGRWVGRRLGETEEFWEPAGG